MVSVTFNCDSKVLTDVDTAAQERELTRSRFITDIIKAYFAPQPPVSIEVNLLKNDLGHLQELLDVRESEITELKELNGRLWQEWHDANTRLLQYQLPAPKLRRSFLDWLRGR